MPIKLSPVQIILLAESCANLLMVCSIFSDPASVLDFLTTPPSSTSSANTPAATATPSSKSTYDPLTIQLLYNRAVNILVLTIPLLLAVPSTRFGRAARKVALLMYAISECITLPAMVLAAVAWEPAAAAVSSLSLVAGMAPGNGSWVLWDLGATPAAGRFVVREGNGGISGERLLKMALYGVALPLAGRIWALTRGGRWMEDREEEVVDAKGDVKVD